MTSRAGAALLVAALATGCYGDHDSGGHHSGYDDGYYDDGCAPGILQTDIDRSGFLDLDPGLGAGATVEYAGGGFWRFAVSCDTFYSGLPCEWDLIVSTIDAELSDVAPEGLEPSDSLARFVGDPDPNAVQLLTTTGDDIDAFTLQTEPGAGVSVDVLLDGACGGTYVSWLAGDEIVASDAQVTELFPLDP